MNADSLMNELYGFAFEHNALFFILKQFQYRCHSDCSIKSHFIVSYVLCAIISFNKNRMHDMNKNELAQKFYYYVLSSIDLKIKPWWNVYQQNIKR